LRGTPPTISDAVEVLGALTKVDRTTEFRLAVCITVVSVGIAVSPIVADHDDPVGMALAHHNSRAIVTVLASVDNNGVTTWDDDGVVARWVNHIMVASRINDGVAAVSVNDSTAMAIRVDDGIPVAIRVDDNATVAVGVDDGRPAKVRGAGGSIVYNSDRSAMVAVFVVDHDDVWLVVVLRVRDPEDDPVYHGNLA